MARPKINIDWDYVDKQLRYHCKGTEIAAKFGIHVNTFYKRCEEHYKCSYSECLEQKREEGNDLLRAAQFENALDGNVSMQIWLGKNYLKQSDKSEIDHSSKDGSMSPDNLYKTSTEELKQRAEALKKINDSPSGSNS